MTAKIKKRKQSRLNMIERKTISGVHLRNADRLPLVSSVGYTGKGSATKTRIKNIEKEFAEVNEIIGGMFLNKH